MTMTIRLTLFLIFFGLGNLSTFAASMVPSNILTRVFCLKIGDQQGTGFTIEVDGRQYLITARHLVSKAPSRGTIEILRDSQWLKIDYQTILVEPTTVDIAVLALPIQISNLLPIELGFKSSYLSQAVFFVGFPYGLSVDGRAINGGFPIPLVKHGIIASLGFNHDPFLVDGINNPGFSGGPVVRAEVGSSPIILGVISAYRAEQATVYAENVKTGLTVGLNTGLLVAYPIELALDAIAKNPIGAPVKS